MAVTGTESVLEQSPIEKTERNNPKLSPSPSIAPIATDLAHSKSYVENCSKFADTLLLAMERTFDHFIKDGGKRPYIKRSDNLNGIEKIIKLIGKKGRILSSSYFDATITFTEPRPKGSKLPDPPRIGLSSRPIYGGYESIGTFRAPYSTLAADIRTPSLQNDMARYIVKIMEQSGDFFTKNSDDTHRTKDIALEHVRDAIQDIYSPKISELKRNFGATNTLS